MVATNLLIKEKKYKINCELDAKTGNRISNSSDEETNVLGQNEELKIDKSVENVPYKMQLVWKNIIAFIIMHLYSIYGLKYFFTQDSYKPIYIQLAFALITNLGVTAGAHRLWSHKAYKAKRPLQYVLATLFVAAGQNDIYEWCRDHRVHHKWSETDADPHNATRGFFFSHIGWLMCKKHPEVIRKGKLIDMSDLENDPMIDFQRHYYKLLHPLLVLFLPSFIVMYYTGMDFPHAMISSVTRYQCVLHLTWLVNSAAHLWGSRPYNDKINPAESPIVIIGTFGLGEGYHNYHHTYPWDYQCSEYGFYQFNVTALFIDVCAYFGWAYDLRKANKQLVNQMKENVIKRRNSILTESEEQAIIDEARAY